MTSPSMNWEKSVGSVLAFFAGRFGISPLFSLFRLFSSDFNFAWVERVCERDYEVNTGVAHLESSDLIVHVLTVLLTLDLTLRHRWPSSRLYALAFRGTRRDVLLGFGSWDWRDDILGSEQVCMTTRTERENTAQRAAR
jgi:hypothetical protein